MMLFAFRKSNRNENGANHKPNKKAHVYLGVTTMVYALNGGRTVSKLTGVTVLFFCKYSPNFNNSVVGFLPTFTSFGLI